MNPVKYINEYGEECYKNVTYETKLSDLDFQEVKMEDSFLNVLHTNLGSLSIVDENMTTIHFGRLIKSVDTGYRDKDGVFWLASGSHDVRSLKDVTIQEVIDFVKENSNICNG